MIGYFVALGNLAGSAPGADTFGVKGLAANLQKSSILSGSAASAIGSLGTDVIQSVYDAKRRGALAAIIPQTDRSVGGAIAFLESLATDHYATFLNAEREASNRFLTRNLRLAKPGADAFAVLQYADSWSTRTKALDEKVGAITSYVNALEKLRKSHAQILTAISTNNAESALAAAKLYYDSLKPDLDAIEKAFADEKAPLEKKST